MEALRINNVLLCYPHIFEKHAPPGTTNLRYSAEFVLDPVKNREDCERVTAAFKKVAIDAGKGNKLQYMKSPLKSGDELNREAQAKGRNARDEFVGKYVIRAADPTTAPAVCDNQMSPIPESKRDQIFGGCIVNGFIHVYYSRNQANPGVYIGLKGIQLVSNTNVTRLGPGAMDVHQMFEPVTGNVDTGPPEQAEPAGNTPSWA